MMTEHPKEISIKKYNEALRYAIEALSQKEIRLSLEGEEATEEEINGWLVDNELAYYAHEDIAKKLLTKFSIRHKE
jgi:hypothetical protein